MIKLNITKQAKITLSMFALLMLLVVTISMIKPELLMINNIRNIINQQAILIIICAGITFLLITGNFDLSIGGLVGAAGVLVAYFCQSAEQGGMGMSFSVAIIITMIVIMLIGLLNAFLVVKLGVASVIATLATMSIARGIAYIVAEGSMIELGLPGDFRILGTFQILNFISIPMLIMVFVVILFMFIEKKTVFGQNVFYIGANNRSSVLSGIKTGKQTAYLYIISAALAGIAGILLASKLGAGDCKVGAGYEFDAVVAVVLGGTSMQGGSGSILGMVFGVLILGVLQNTLNLFGVAPDWQAITKGIVIVVAILLQRLAINKMSN